MTMALAPTCPRSSRLGCHAHLPSSFVLPTSVVALPPSLRAGRRGSRLNGRNTRLLVEASTTLKDKIVSDVVWGDTESREDARKYRRTVFDHGKWRTHRSPGRYARHIVGLIGSRIVRGLGRPILLVTATATFVCVYEAARAEGKYIPKSWPTLTFPASGTINLTNFALSLLLVFRTNSSYGRWDEARKLWGSLLNRTRDLVRQGTTWFPAEEQELADMLARWTKAFAHSLKDHLREDTDLSKDLSGILTEAELKDLLASTHRPLYTLQVLTEVIRTSSLSDIAINRMDDNLTLFEDVLGACERIFKTPIVLSYTRHTSRTLVIWLAFLPFTIWPQQGWATIPNCAIIAFLLLGIEEIGVQIEEPFSILPLEAICGSVESNLDQITAQRLSDSSTHAALKAKGAEMKKASERNGSGRQNGSSYSPPTGFTANTMVGWNQ